MKSLFASFVLAAAVAATSASSNAAIEELDSYRDLKLGDFKNA